MKDQKMFLCTPKVRCTHSCQYIHMRSGKWAHSFLQLLGSNLGRPRIVSTRDGGTFPSSWALLGVQDQGMTFSKPLQQCNSQSLLPLTHRDNHILLFIHQTRSSVHRLITCPFYHSETLLGHFLLGLLFVCSVSLGDRTQSAAGKSPSTGTPNSFHADSLRSPRSQPWLTSRPQSSRQKLQRLL